MPANAERREPVAEGEAHRDADTPNPENTSDRERDNESVSTLEEGDQKKDKYDRSGPHPIIGLIIFLVLQFIAILLLCVATPIELFTLNDTWRDLIFPSLVGTNEKLCVTAWGMKAGCRSTGYYNRDYTTNFCYRVRTNFRVIEAFFLMSLAFMVFAFIAALFSVCQKVGKGSVGALSVFAVMVCVIPWGVVAGMYWQKPCCETDYWHTPQQVRVCVFSNGSQDVPPFKDMGSYGAGFGLTVTAWCLQVVASIFAFLPI